ncbi:MAG: hypothetical protein L0Y39_04855 [Methylococcaceae bacterium]|nr:hypothetical protein [Methylococcaceae bacterium]
MPPSFECVPIELAGSLAVRAGSDRDLAQAFDLLGLKNRAVLVLVGGAGSMDTDSEDGSLRNLFFAVLAPLAESLQAIVIDGGTDSGIMRLMGAARSEIRGTFPLLGVAAIDTVDLPKRSGKGKQGTCPLEPRHSHFLIVPGERWGDESPWIARVASLLSAGFRSLTVVVNGGEITLRDISFSIRERRPIAVVSGSGRTADRLAVGLDGGSEDPEIRALLSSGLIQVLEIDRDPDQLIRTLGGWLTD